MVEQPIFVWVEMVWMIVFSWLVAVVVLREMSVTGDSTRFPLADTVEGTLQLMDITLAARAAARHPEGQGLSKEAEKH